jgi:hypothetical protein
MTIRSTPPRSPTSSIIAQPPPLSSAESAESALSEEFFPAENDRSLRTVASFLCIFIIFAGTIMFISHLVCSDLTENQHADGINCGDNSLIASVSFLIIVAGSLLLYIAYGVYYNLPIADPIE